jgi:GxxExxY protein
MAQGVRGSASTEEDLICSEIIGGCIEVHRYLGPGLLESAYEAAVCQELRLRGIRFLRQVEIPLAYKGLDLACSYRLDLVANDRIVVEFKAVERLLPIHVAQLLTYLKLTPYNSGLLINFNVPLLKQGIRRINKTNPLLYSLTL